MSGLTDPTQASVAELALALASGRTSAVELAHHFLNRVASSPLNAFIDVQPELTLSQAQAADQRLARGERGPLLGIPIAHKDIFVTRGWRSTAGSRMLADYVSPYDATVVERLASAGAVCLGKTNCDEFAMGGQTKTPTSVPPATPGIRRPFRADPQAGRRLRWRAGLPRLPPAPIPAARSDSPPPCAASPASSPPTDASRAGA